MATISIKLSTKYIKIINRLIGSGFGSNQADVIYYAVKKAQQNEVVENILKAQKEIGLGGGLEGDLLELAKQFK